MTGLCHRCTHGWILTQGRKISEAVATFFIEEAESNRGDEPHLDAVLYLDHGSKVLYHPGAQGAALI